jgi:hypothetical protein
MMAKGELSDGRRTISRATKAAVSKVRTPAKSRTSRTKIRDKASRVRTPAKSQVNRARTRTRNKAAKAVDQQKARPCGGLSVGWPVITAARASCAEALAGGVKNGPLVHPSGPLIYFRFFSSVCAISRWCFRAGNVFPAQSLSFGSSPAFA